MSFPKYYKFIFHLIRIKMYFFNKVLYVQAFVFVEKMKIPVIKLFLSLKKRENVKMANINVCEVCKKF